MRTNPADQSEVIQAKPARPAARGPRARRQPEGRREQPLAPIRRILCPVDFSEFSRAAVEQAIAVARACQADLTALFVFPLVFPAGDDVPYGPVPVAPDAGVRSAVAEDLDELFAPARAAGLRVRNCLKTGSPVEQILEQVTRTEADLVVMGTHGRSGFERWVLGSVTDKVLRKAPCPVMTVSRPAGAVAAAPLRRILCALDLSESSARTLLYALTLGRLTGATVTLLHVLEGDPAARGQAHLAAGIRGRLHSAALADGEPGCPVEEMVVTGRAYREILRLAEAMPAGLIVMGTHGPDPIDRMFFGSTADHVVRAATVPVMTVRDTSP